MANPFAHTLRAVRVDGQGRALVAIGVGALLLAAWGTFMVRAELDVLAVSNEARVDARPARVDAPVGGTIQSVPVSLGQRVERGDVIVRLDVRPLELDRAVRAAEAARVAAERARLSSQLESKHRALSERVAAGEKALGEARAAVRGAEEALAHARAEIAHAEVVVERKLAPEIELRRARAAADQRAAEAERARFDVESLAHRLESDREDREAAIRALEQGLSALDGQAEVIGKDLERLDDEIARRAVRAGVAGTIAELEARLGAVIAPGHRLASIVPDGPPRLVAYLAPDATAGRVRPGLAGTVRMHGYPFTVYGTVQAEVMEVGAEPSERGLLEVHLRLEPPPPGGPPLVHGMPATVEIEVERMSPLALLLRAVGKRLTSASGSAARPAGAP